jgi:hypothetical protein
VVRGSTDGAVRAAIGSNAAPAAAALCRRKVRRGNGTVIVIPRAAIKGRVATTVGPIRMRDGGTHRP